MSKIIGIDLGTTNSCVAVMEGGEAVVIPNSEGARTTPSVVAFKDNERLVGQVAKRQAITNPEKTISSIKRHMGTDYKVNIDGKSVHPAGNFRNDPAEAEDRCRGLSGRKGDRGGYHRSCLLHRLPSARPPRTPARSLVWRSSVSSMSPPRLLSPTASIRKTSQKIMVYDLGGGTFDVSIIEMGDGVQEVLATAGNNRLGGDDFDERLLNCIGSMTSRRPTASTCRKDKMAHAAAEGGGREGENASFPA